MGFNSSLGGSVAKGLEVSFGGVVAVIVAGVETTGVEGTAGDADFVAETEGVTVAVDVVVSFATAPNPVNVGFVAVGIAFVVGVVTSAEAGAPNNEVEPNVDVATGDLAPGTVFLDNDPKPPAPITDGAPNALVVVVVTAVGGLVVDVEPNNVVDPEVGAALVKVADGDVAPGTAFLATVPNAEVAGIVAVGDFAPGIVFFARDPKLPPPNVLEIPKADVGAVVVASVLLSALDICGFFSSFVLVEPKESDETLG